MARTAFADDEWDDDPDLEDDFDDVVDEDDDDLDETDAEADELECEDYFALMQRCAAELRASLALPTVTDEERAAMHNAIAFFDAEAKRRF